MEHDYIPPTPQQPSRSKKLFLRRTLIIAVPVLALMLITALLILIFRGCSTRESAATLRAWKENTAHIQVTEQIARKNSCYISGKRIEIEGLMLHSVGTPQPSAKVFADRFNAFQPGGSEVCVHAFLQADGTVYQILPWDMYGWHAGGSANRTHIGVEMCEPAEIVYTGPSTVEATDLEAAQNYAVGAYNTAAELFAALCIRYDLDPMEEGVIISHTEGAAAGMASNHNDPEHLWNGLGLPYTMDTFRAEVAERMEEMNN